MTKAEEKGRALITRMTTDQIVTQFEMTENMTSAESYMVRGWYMDELEKRDPVAFEEWIFAVDEVSPRRFFLKEVIA